MVKRALLPGIFADYTADKPLQLPPGFIFRSGVLYPPSRDYLDFIELVEGPKVNLVHFDGSLYKLEKTSGAQSGQEPADDFKEIVRDGADDKDLLEYHRKKAADRCKHKNGGPVEAEAVE